MTNELLFFASILATYACAVAIFRFFGKAGLFAWSVFATVLANIEVVKTIELFGFETTLGNVLFGTTFFVTDVLSECYGKREAKRCVWLSLSMMAAFVCLLQFSLAFAPSANDFAAPHMTALFALAPRVVFASLLLYFLASMLDVALYHWVWARTGEGEPRFLWLRNNVSTMTAQAVQQILFAFCIFYGVEGFDFATILEIGLTTTVVTMFISFCDTPFLYLARGIFHRRKREVTRP